MARAKKAEVTTIETDKVFPVGQAHTKKIRRDGAVTIPAEIREKFRLLKGTTILEMQALTNGDILIRRASNECNCCKQVMEQPTDVSRGLGVCKKCEREVLNMVRENCVSDKIKEVVAVKAKPANMFELDYYLLCLKAYYVVNSKGKTKKSLQRTCK